MNAGVECEAPATDMRFVDLGAQRDRVYLLLIEIAKNCNNGAVILTTTGVVITGSTDFVRNLNETAKQLKAATGESLALRKAYLPGVEVAKESVGSLMEMIDALDVRPKDMLVSVAERNDQAVVLVSGVASREAFYSSTVLPALRKLVGIVQGS